MLASVTMSLVLGFGNAGSMRVDSPVVVAGLALDSANTPVTDPPDRWRAAQVLVAVLALVVAAGALMGAERARRIAVRAAETSANIAAVQAWNVAHSRIGQLYDMAINDAELRELVDEPADPAASRAPPPRTPKQRLWTSNLLLAIEQATIATTAMPPETRRVWERYVKRALTRPTMRAEFLASELEYRSKDGKEWGSEDTVIRLALEALLGLHVDKVPKRDEFIARLVECHAKLRYPDDQRTGLPRELTDGDLRAIRLVAGDAEQRGLYESDLRALYRCGGDNMLPLPVDWDLAMLDATRYVILRGDRVVGAFSLYPMFGEGSCGLIVHPTARATGVGRQAFTWIDECARRLGWGVLYADVYDDNTRMSEIFARQPSWRRFSWWARVVPPP